MKAIVVACNTASAFALDTVRDEFDIPIIGVIESGAKVAAAGHGISVWELLGQWGRWAVAFMPST